MYNIWSWKLCFIVIKSGSHTWVKNGGGSIVAWACILLTATRNQLHSKNILEQSVEPPYDNWDLSAFESW